MKKLFAILAVLALAGTSAAATDAPPSPAAAARRILEAYRADHPEPAAKKLHVVCWRSRERAFPANQQARLQGILEHIRNFYAAQIERNGLGRLTFPLDYDAKGRLVIHEAVGSGTYDDYNKQTGRPIRDDAWAVLRRAGIEPDHETVLIFSNLAVWDPKARTFSHHSPYQGGGSCAAGICWQLDHPALDVKNLPLREPMITDGEYGRISLGKHNSIFIGGIAHELGHALSLPHCHESAAEAKTLGTALMGSGNRTYADEVRGEGKGSFLTLASALRLAAHPLFTGSVKGLGRPVEARFTHLAVTAAGREFTLAGTVAADVPVYAVVGYLDPEGGSDYDARTAVTVPEADGRFALRCSELVPGRPAELRLYAYLANGAVTLKHYDYRVAKDGTPDVAVMDVAFTLEPFLTALAAGDRRAAAAARDALPDGGQARRIAATIFDRAHGKLPQTPPAKISAEVKSVPLSHVAPAQARVGWLRPTYDMLPRRDALLMSGGELFETGIYAHAPAAYRYDLGGGWRRLTGKCGLAADAFGTVVFVIRTDGKEVLRTKTMKSGRTRAFDVDLTGVHRLELITEDAGDDNRGDWGLWLGPELTR